MNISKIFFLSSVLISQTLLGKRDDIVFGPETPLSYYQRVCFSSPSLKTLNDGLEACGRISSNNLDYLQYLELGMALFLQKDTQITNQDRDLLEHMIDNVSIGDLDATTARRILAYSAALVEKEESTDIKRTRGQELLKNFDIFIDTYPQSFTIVDFNLLKRSLNILGLFGDFGNDPKQLMKYYTMLINNPDSSLSKEDYENFFIYFHNLILRPFNSEKHH